MNKEYALEILDMLERGTVEYGSLAKEAIRYLLKTKYSPELYTRICVQRDKHCN